MEPNQGIKAWQWIVTVVVIIVLIIIGYYVFKGGSAAPTPADQTPIADNGGSSTDINRLVVSDQYPGNIVYITSVQLAAPGWVAIHKDNNGTPGAIIGTEYFASGINPGKITLSEKTVEGGLYYAMLHSDNGDQKFDMTVDLPLKDAQGNIIMKPFRATSSVSEVKG